jgi:hypothetical protein
LRTAIGELVQPRASASSARAWSSARSRESDVPRPSCSLPTAIHFCASWRRAWGQARIAGRQRLPRVEAARARAMRLSLQLLFEARPRGRRQPLGRALHAPDRRAAAPAPRAACRTRCRGRRDPFAARFRRANIGQQRWTCCSRRAGDSGETSRARDRRALASASCARTTSGCLRRQRDGPLQKVFGAGEVVVAGEARGLPGVRARAPPRCPGGRHFPRARPRARHGSPPTPDPACPCAGRARPRAARVRWRG